MSKCCLFDYAKQCLANEFYCSLASIIRDESVRGSDNALPILYNTYCPEYRPPPQGATNTSLSLVYVSVAAVVIRRFMFQINVVNVGKYEWAADGGSSSSSSAGSRSHRAPSWLLLHWCIATGGGGGGGGTACAQIHWSVNNT